ncbi:hypothetical protein KKF38_03880 [Patescibacteria group bacterium]|nr:hypothetical protein [Patescibacteria group bacterium]
MNIIAASSRARDCRPKTKKFWNDEVIATLNARINDKEIPAKQAYAILDKRIEKRLGKSK